MIINKINSFHKLENKVKSERQFKIKHVFVCFILFNVLNNRINIIRLRFLFIADKIIIHK